jgi:hypothetical protein
MIIQIRDLKVGDKINGITITEIDVYSSYLNVWFNESMTRYTLDSTIKK